ncbi:MAG: MFS transporter [Planctomycetota bacterium]
MMTDNQSDIQMPFYAKWANKPFAPAKCPFFYGWVIVAVSTLSVVCSIPGQTNGVSLFTDHLIETLGTDRNALAIAYMIGTITSGLILPFAGKLLDKIGVRLMSVFASGGLALSLLVLSQVGRINDLLQALMTFQYMPVAVAAFAFLLIRFFGQGNMTMVGRVAMGKWFNNRRGIATAIAGVPIAFSFNAAPWIMNKIIEVFGWRHACWVLALVVGGFMGLIGLLLFRDRPEHCGLVMDGKTETNENTKAAAIHKVYHQFTRAEAGKTLSFWTFTLGLAVNGLIITALSFHLTDIGAEMGKSRDQIVTLFLCSSFIAIPARFLVSYLVDNTQLQLRRVLTCLSLTMLTYTAGMMFLNTTLGWWTTTVFIGLTGGLWGVLFNVTFPRFFGRDHLGAISGLNMSIQVIASAIGPWLFSVIKTGLGSYRIAAMLMLILPAIVLILSFLAGNPQHNHRPE